MGIRNHFAAVLLVFLLISCASAPEKPEPPGEEPWELFSRRIASLEEEGRILEALAELNNQKYRFTDSREVEVRIGLLETALTESIPGLWEAGDYTRLLAAADYYELMKISSPPVSRSSVYKALARNVREVGGPEIQALWYDRAAGESPWSIRSGRSGVSAGQLADPLKATSAVATVWVDRGMTIDRGVGRPDRVLGTGFFVDKAGYLITNYHVISSEVDPEYEGYSRVYIRPSGRWEEKVPARVVGYDPFWDLAVLKTEMTPEAVLALDFDRILIPGDRIYALGSPGGLENTITGGIVSARDRRFLAYGDVVQVDVPINSGNSGGPLIDGAGRVTGVVFAGVESMEGINFVLPLEWIRLFWGRLFDEGPAAQPWVGIAASSVDRKPGLEVLYVDPRGPASRWGLRAGDRIRAVDGSSVRNLTDVHRILLAKEPGRPVLVDWESSDGKDRSSLAILGSRPEKPYGEWSARRDPEPLLAPLFGMTVQYVDQFLGRITWRIDKIWPGSPADETGLSVNDSFEIVNTVSDPDSRILILQLKIKRRKLGYLESYIQIGAPLEANHFF